MKKNQNRRRIAGAGRISDLPESERPYEKCERFGAGALSDAELLAVLLRTGSEGTGALEMSRSILESLGSGGIAQLHKASMEDLQEIRGIGKVKATQIRCIAELSRRIAQAKIGSQDSLVYDSPEVDLCGGTRAQGRIRHSPAQSSERGSRPVHGGYRAYEPGFSGR